MTTLSSFVGLMEGAIRYDAAEDLFIYNWKTRKGDPGCRLVTVTLDDGTRHAAKFKLQ